MRAHVVGEESDDWTIAIIVKALGGSPFVRWWICARMLWMDTLDTVIDIELKSSAD